MDTRFHAALLVYLLLNFLSFSSNIKFATTVQISNRDHNKASSTSIKHFVLVHGAGHGAWCWYKVATLLKTTGYNVTALDMTASGINPLQVRDLKIGSILDYVKPLTDFMSSLPATVKVVLVGHSLGGLSLSVAMENFPEKISAAVFVTAVMPGPTLSYLNISQETTRSLGSIMDSTPIYSRGRNNSPTALLAGPNLLASKVYQLSPPEDLVLALTLVRPAPLFNDEELVLKETKFTKKRYGSVSRVFIVCDRDQTIDVGVQWWMIKNNPPNEVKVINGSDHMAMFSKPLKLFSYLREISETYS